MSVVKVEGVKVELLGKMNREKRNTAGIGPDRYSPSEESERQVPTKDKKKKDKKKKKNGKSKKSTASTTLTPIESPTYLGK